MPYYFQPPIFAMPQPIVGGVYAPVWSPPAPTVVYVAVPSGLQQQAQPPLQPVQEAQQQEEAQEADPLHRCIDAPPRAIIRAIFRSHDAADQALWLHVGDTRDYSSHTRSPDPPPSPATVRADVGVLADALGLGDRPWDEPGRVVLYVVRRRADGFARLRVLRDAHGAVVGGGDDGETVLAHSVLEARSAEAAQALRGVVWESQAVFVVVDVSREARIGDEAAMPAAEA